MPDLRISVPHGVVVAASLLIGLAIRFVARNYPPSDADLYVYWYNFARSAGADSLRLGLTNYAPIYSYLFYAITRLDGWLSIFASIKLISLPFELGCAIMAYRLIALSHASSLRPAMAFAATWLAPAVIFNGALWAQAEAVWTFFIMLTVYAICRGKPVLSMVAFALAVCIKLQAIFYAPVIFALLLRREVHWIWLSLVPLAYLISGLPLIAIGRPLADVVLVYANQAQFFHDLSKNAANLWVFVPNEYYAPGVVIGVAAAGLAGLAFALWIAREAVWAPPFVVLTSALCLQLIPWALPKMHDRYFYGFEVMMIVAAFMQPRLAFLAVVTQLDALIVYAGVDGGGGLGTWGIPLAAMLNSVILVAMIGQVTTGRYVDLSLGLLSVLGSYLTWMMIVLATASGVDAMAATWPAKKNDFAGLLEFTSILIAFGTIVAVLTWLQRRTRNERKNALTM